jgi:hypothetical protein
VRIERGERGGMEGGREIAKRDKGQRNKDK